MTNNKRTNRMSPEIIESEEEEMDSPRQERGKLYDRDTSTGRPRDNQRTRDTMTRGAE
jgi:hypothetical protein